MKRHLAPSVALLALAVAIVALAAGPAPASRPATPAQAEFVIQGIVTSKVGGINRVPKRWYQVTRIRISTANSNYAAAYLAATPAGRNKFQPTNVLVGQLTSGTWAVLDLDVIPCNIAPKAVLVDLFHGCFPASGPKFVSFQVVSAVTCTRGSQVPVPAIWHFVGAQAISFSVDGQPLSAAAGYPPSGTGNVPVPCDGGRHEIWLFAYGRGQTQSGPFIHVVKTVIG
jgi:hypothetical protein